MKVLLVSTNASLRSGACWSMVGLAKELKQMGVDVTVCLPRHGDCEAKLEDSAIRYFIIPYLIKDVRSLDWKKEKFYLVKSLIRNLIDSLSQIILSFNVFVNGYDLIHINALTTFQGAAASFRFGIPLIWHAREFLEEDLKLQFVNEYKAKSLLNKANCVVAVSDSVADKLREKYGLHNVRRVYNGIDISKFEKISRNKCFKELRILIVGRISQGKNQALLVSALSMLRETNLRRVHCEIVGPVDDSTYHINLIRSIKQQHLESVISVSGFDNDVASRYKTANVLVVCAEWEAFGRTTIEGLSAGCLVVGPNSGGTAELIRDGVTGLLYEHGNARDLSKSLSWIFQHPEEASKIASAGQSRAISAFSANNNARQIYDIYTDVLNRADK